MDVRALAAARDRVREEHRDLLWQGCEPRAEKAQQQPGATVL